MLLTLNTFNHLLILLRMLELVWRDDAILSLSSEAWSLPLELTDEPYSSLCLSMTGCMAIERLSMRKLNEGLI